MITRRDYSPEEAEALMCVPACLNMIFRRHGLPPIAQADIACELGLVVPPRLESRFPLARVSEDPRDWGVHPQDDQSSLNAFFKRHAIPLAERFYLPTQISGSFGYSEFLGTALELRNDIIVGYDYATVFHLGGNVGHVSLVCEVDTTNDMVRILDPESANEGTHEVHLRDLLAGIRMQRDGFWIIGSHESVTECEKLI